MTFPIGALKTASFSEVGATREELSVGIDAALRINRVDGRTDRSGFGGRAGKAMPSRFERLIVVGIDKASLFAQEHPAQPLHGRILVDAHVPEEVGLIVRNARGFAENHVVAPFCDAAGGELQARHRDKIRAAQTLEGLREVRHPNGRFQGPIGDVGLIRHEGIVSGNGLRRN